MLMEQVESYKQCYVHNDSHVDVCVELEKGVMNMEQDTKQAARKRQIDRQEEKKPYTHYTNA